MRRSPLNDSAHDNRENHDELLRLSLSTGSRPLTMAAAAAASPPLLGQAYHQPPTTMPVLPQSLFRVTPPPSPASHHHHHHHYPEITSNNSSSSSSSGSSRTRNRRSPVQKLKPGKTETIPAPYPWATDRRATVHCLEYLLSSHHLNTISGEVECKRCEKKYEIEYDLQEKFTEVASFVSENKYAMHARAPDVWKNPNLPNCKLCGQTNCVKPILGKKKTINWLFLLLGQMLGCCKLSELKYFCKHTKNHRTGAKDRVLYLTYLGLCKQLDPKGPFDAV